MEKLQLEYLNPQIALGYDFYMSPKLIYDHEAFSRLDYGSKHLYCRMLSRASLSARNASKFTDNEGRLYIIYTVEQVMKDMWCSEPTAIKMLKQLENIGLIERKRQGQGKPSITYVKDFASVKFLNLKSLRSGTKNLLGQDLKDFKPSNNNLSEKNLSEINPINQRPEIKEERLIDRIDDDTHEVYEELVKSNIDYDVLKTDIGQRDGEILDEIVGTIVETVSSKKEVIRVNGEEKPTNVVKGQLLKLDIDHINYVMDCLKKNTTKVHNIKAYVLTTLYNAPNTISNYYQQAVNYDFRSSG